MTKRRIITLLLCAVTLFSAYAAPSLSIGKVCIENIGLNKRLMRLNDYGLFLDQAMAAMEVTVNISATGLSGKRVVAIVTPIDADGCTLADNNGEALSMAAVTVPSSSYSGKLIVPIPYTWVVSMDGKTVVSTALHVELTCVKDQNISASKVIELNEQTVHIDSSNMTGKLMGDLLGGSGSGGDLVTSLIGGMFGGDTVDATTTCPACEGTGLCSHCDGEGFLDPQSCRKCAGDPGICRRCHGTGSITMTFDVY